MKIDYQDYEQLWENHWKKNCTNLDGSINLDQIKRELSDYAFMLDQVPSVYSEVTGGTLSKTNYYSGGVIAAYENHVNELIKNHVQDIKEQVEGMKCGDHNYDDAIDDVIDFLKEEYQIE
jgi:hypothetical protein